VRVTGTGSCLPERVVDNDALRRIVHGYDEARSGPFGRWVDQVSHVHERRFVADGVRTSDMAAVAARRALEMAGLEAKDLGMIVYASFTPSQQLPGDHCLLTADLGVPTVPTFNLMAACAGSVYGLGLAYAMVSAGVYEHVMVTGAETISRTLNYHDPLTAILFGDGAGAAIVSRRSGPEGTGMFVPHLASHFSARSIHLANSNVPVEVAAFPERALQPGVPLVEQALIHMEGGPSVLKNAVAHMANAVARVLGFDEGDVRRRSDGFTALLDRARVVPHQANGRIVDGLADRLHLPPERVIRTIYRYGNTSAASNLIALDHGLRVGNMRRDLDADGNVLGVRDAPEDRIRSGDLVVMPSIGGGYLIGCAAFTAP
jgi:3-oxoacyl-[acyl-carrier-protein] synthase-3